MRALGTSRGPLLDLIRHLCGRLPPGVSQTPAPSRTRIERVQRHYDEINTTLTFLKYAYMNTQIIVHFCYHSGLKVLYYGLLCQNRCLIGETLYIGGRETHL